MQLAQVIFLLLSWISPQSTVFMQLTLVIFRSLDGNASWVHCLWTSEKLWFSVSCLINTEPLGLLHLQPSESFASESVIERMIYTCYPSWLMSKRCQYVMPWVCNKSSLRFVCICLWIWHGLFHFRQKVQWVRSQSPTFSRTNITR